MTFATQYRSVVGPRLRRRCKLAALHIALGEIGFSDAVAAISREAIRLGSTHLPNDVGDKLVPGQIMDWLIDDLSAATAAVDEAETLASRVSVDVSDHMRRFCRSMGPLWPDRVVP